MFEAFGFVRESKLLGCSTDERHLRRILSYPKTLTQCLHMESNTCASPMSTSSLRSEPKVRGYVCEIFCREIIELANADVSANFHQRFLDFDAWRCRLPGSETFSTHKSTFSAVSHNPFSLSTGTVAGWAATTVPEIFKATAAKHGSAPAMGLKRRATPADELPTEFKMWTWSE